MPKFRLILLLLIACAAGAALAQTPDTATLTGVVTDSTHAVVPGATVSVTNLTTGLQRAATSNGQGKFSIVGLPVGGAYTVTASKPGFAETKLASTTLAGGSAAEISLELAVAGGKAEVTVVGAAGEVRVDQPQTGIYLDETQIDATPLPNERITFLPLLSAANRPGINLGDIFMDQDLFTTNGAGRRQTWFEVDGASGNDSWGRQTIFTNIPKSAVQEMTVLTNAFSAEYGASTGSVVNIVTKSGGDSYHGSAYGNWRPITPEAALYGYNAANLTSGNEITNDRLIQEGFSFGGPAKFSEKTRFFLAGEHSGERKASPVNSAIDTTVFEGVYHDWMGLARLDHQFSEKHNGFFKFNADAYFDTNPNGIVGGTTLPTVARTFHRRTYTTELGDTYVFGPHLLNNARVQFQLASPITEFDPVIDSTQYVVTITGLTGLASTKFTTGTSQSALLMNRQYGFGDTLTATWGKHQINFGGDANISHTGGNSKEFGGPVYDGAFTFNNCPGPGGGATNAQIEAYCETTWIANIANVASYSQSYGNAAYTVTDAIWSVFAQDDWHLAKRLTINGGLRYERQTFADAQLNLAPRVGFDWDPFGKGGTIVRGGFGIYYSQIVDNEEADYALTGPTGVFSYSALPGQVGFPSSLAAAPLPAFPASATPPIRSLYLRPGLANYYNQFFPTSTLVGYPSKLLNPYSEQYTASLEQKLGYGWLVDVDYVGTHQLRNLRPLDVDAPPPFVRTAQNQFYNLNAPATLTIANATQAAYDANCDRPYWVYFYAQHGTTCDRKANSGVTPPYSEIQSDVNDGYLHYNALDINIHHAFSKRYEALLSYTWSHNLDNVDPDATSQNPNLVAQTGHAEYGPAIYDQRHRAVLSGFYLAPLSIHIGGIATLASGLPYNLTTGTVNSGDTGATTDRPVINGVVVSRNSGRGTPNYQVDPFVSRTFPIHERFKLDLRAEAFNVANHPNFVTFGGVYGNGAAPTTIGLPSFGVTAQLPARFMQFSGKLVF